MTKTLDEIQQTIRSMCDKEVEQSKEFGIEFGTYSEKVTHSTIIKSIHVSSYTNLKLIHAMNEVKSNLAITILPLSIIKNGFPLSEVDYELLKSLVINNIKTVSLSENWLYSQNGAFAYFLQTLGINQFSQQTFSVSGNKVSKWITDGIFIKDFLSNLSHLTKRWIASINTSENESEIFVIQREKSLLDNLEQLKQEGVTTVIGFELDSNHLEEYKQNHLNFIFVPIQDFCNIALRKFSQLLQMKLDQKVIFFPQEIKKWLNPEDLSN